MTDTGADRPTTLQDLTDRLRDPGAATALVEAGPGTALGYAALADRADAIAAGLATEGWPADEPVALVGENGIAWVAAALGLLRAGLVPVPLDPVMPEADFRHALTDSGARRVLVTRRRLATVRRLLADLDTPPRPVLIDPDGPDGDAATPDAPARLPVGEGPPPRPARGPDDTAVLFYTSGTTGRPKGVPLSHRNIGANVDALTAPGLLPRGLRAVLPLPLFHVYPFVVGLLSGLSLGATVIFPAGLGGPDLVAALRDHRATALIGVPRLYDALIAAVERRGGRRAVRWLDAAGWVARHLGPRPARWLSAPLRRRLAPDLAVAVSGGAALDPATARRLQALGLDVLTGYGLTETAPIVSFDRPGMLRPGAAGRPLDGLTVRIVDADEDGVGEIAVRGPNVFAGYRGLPDKTAEVLDAEGWFHTGDLGRLDAAGYLRIGARRSSLISLGGGQTVVPETLEDLLDAEPEIAESAVLAPQGRLVALVRPDPDARRGRPAREAVDAALARVRDRLPGDARLSDVALVTAPLPRTPIGKLRRHRLPELWQAAQSGESAPAAELSAEDRTLLDDPDAAALWDWLQRRFPERPLSLDADPQTALGIDSLDWVTLSLELDHNLGLRLDEAAWGRLTSLRDLLALAAGGGGEAGEASVPKPGDLTAEDRRWTDPPPWPARGLARLALAVDRLAFATLWPLTVEGADRVPTEGPVILAPNHASYLDPMALAAALPTRRLVRLRWAGSSRVMASTGPRRLASRILRVLPVEERRRPGVGLALAEAVLDRGEAVVWFPEGRRAPDGELLAFQPGIGRLVDRAGVPVVPVAITGTGAAWGVDRRWPRRGAIRVRFGSPVPAADLAADAVAAEADVAARYRTIAASLRDRVAALRTGT